MTDGGSPTPEGQRIHQFIGLMKQCDCSFDSQVIPNFSANARFEFWDGEFTFRPARLSITSRLTLDHDFVALRTDRRLDRTVVREKREELHLLLTGNQVSYRFEPDGKSTDHLVIVLTMYIYGDKPRVDRVRHMLDTLDRTCRELAEAVDDGFSGYRPLIP
ncbi:MAG: hypothetical protein ACYTGX_14990 [Planctomycetota bacterium]|jgi:hypothetical protein